MGIKVTDKGQVTLQDAANGNYEGYRTHFQWKIGLTVRDWRYVVRIGDIDVSNLEYSGSGDSDDLVTLMVRATEKLPTLKGRMVFYVNETIRTYLRTQILAKSNVNLTYDTVAGKRVLAFDNIPVRRCDKIGIADAQIT